MEYHPGHAAAREQGLASLADADLQAVSSAYGDLYMRPAAISKTGRIRRVGPTAAAKLLYFIRPMYCRHRMGQGDLPPPRTGGGRDQSAFLRHLTTCRGWAISLEAERAELGLKPTDIGPISAVPSPRWPSPNRRVAVRRR